MQRANVNSMTTPDPYGNLFGSMIPKGTIKPSGKLTAKTLRELQNVRGGDGSPQEIMQDARESAARLTPVEKPVAGPAESFKMAPISEAVTSGVANIASTLKTSNLPSSAPSVSPVDAAASAGSGAVSGGADIVKSGMSSATKGALTSAGVGALSAGASALGDVKNSQGKEDAGGVLKGAAAGASMGGMIGSVIPGVGNLAGAGIGAFFGGVAGGIKGSKDRKARKGREAKDEQARNAYNKDLKIMKGQIIGQAEDRAKYRSLLNSTSSYSLGGEIKFKKGGILKYDKLNIKSANRYLDSLDVEYKQKGGVLKDVSIVGKGDIPKVKKKLGKAKTFKKKSCGGKCACKTCSHEAARIFRRGGKMDVNKQNVIIDGPSHDDNNNTGVKGDRGLPVVKNGKKVAEIESDELIINADSSKMIEELRDRIVKGDKKAKEELAELLSKELGENTYDYSNLTK